MSSPKAASPRPGAGIEFNPVVIDRGPVSVAKRTVTTYVALLRGINLGPRNKVGMDDLRGLFAALGHDDVRTHLRSGNVIFKSPTLEAPRLARDIEERIAQNLGATITVLLRTKDDLVQVVAGNPFLDRQADFSKMHVTFLADAPDRERVKRLQAPVDEPDEFSLVGREVYLYCPNGYGRTKLNNAYFEKRLGVGATTRNWNTVTKLHELSAR